MDSVHGGRDKSKDEVVIPDVHSGVDRARRLQVFRCGRFHFGIFADSIKSTTEWQTPARLPHAPNAVLGVVGVRGHMLTVLDAINLLGETDPHDYSSGLLIALRGDEQLALAVNEVGDLIEITQADVQPALNSNRLLVMGLLSLDGETVFILNEKELFSKAIQGRERRRRRF